MSWLSWMSANVVACCLISTITIIDANRVGTAVDVLTNFGDLYLKFRISPRNDTEPWVFYDDPIPVLKNMSVKRFVNKNSNVEFRIELCDDTEQLMATYFRHFAVEGVEDAWKPLSLGWSQAKRSSSMGVQSHLTDFGFIVLKLDVQKELYSLQRPGDLNQPVQELFDRVTAGNGMSAIKFYQRVGTHYIHSYSTGNSLFQVLVYERQVYGNLKRRLTGPDVPETNFAAMTKYLSPLYAHEVGRVMVASGNLALSRWANEILRRKRSHLKTKYPSLFSVMWHTKIADEFVSRTGPEAVVGLRLELIDRLVSAPENKKTWYHLFIDNVLKLNENNG